MTRPGILRFSLALGLAGLAAAAAAGCSSDPDAPPSPEATLQKDTGVVWNVDVDPRLGTPDLVAAQSEPPPIVVGGITHEEATYRFFEKYRAIFKMKDPRAELRVTEKLVDEEGATHVKLAQWSAGVRVDGAGYNVHFTPRGSLGFLNGEFLADLLAANHAPRIDAAAALAGAEQALRATDPTYTPATLAAPVKSELVFVASPYALRKLAWRVELVGRAARHYAMTYYVDAETGAVAHAVTGVHEEYGFGQGARDFRVFEVTKVGDEEYEMSAPADSGRVPMSTYRPGEATPIRSKKIDEWDPVAAGGGGVGLAIDGHSNMMDVLAWYSTELKWSSYDGKRSPVKVTIHEPKDTANAYWWNDQIYLGDGTVHQGGDAYPRGYLDVVAHELTHGVTQYTSGLRYEGESGALNESISDIFGSLAQSNLEPWGNLQAHGEFGSVSGAPVRDFKSPTAQGYVDCYDNLRNKGEAPTRDNDYAGVHYNSSISNNAYVLMTFGGKNETSGISVGAGIDTLASRRVWWFTQRSVATPGSTFDKIAREQLAGIRFYSWFPNALADWFTSKPFAVSIEPVACAWVATGVVTQKLVKDRYDVTCYCDKPQPPASVCGGDAVLEEADYPCCKPEDTGTCCRMCEPDAGRPDDLQVDAGVPPDASVDAPKPPACASAPKDDDYCGWEIGYEDPKARVVCRDGHVAAFTACDNRCYRDKEWGYAYCE